MAAVRADRESSAMVAPMTQAMKICLALVLLAPACNDKDEGPAATATLIGLNGSGVSGTVRFTTQGDEVRVEADVYGLQPGLHGIHIHEFGDCSSPDGESAGGHFNPTNRPHGPPGEASHPGDLGNVEADMNGTARLALTVPQITVDTEPLGVIGRSVVVHEMADDLMTDPAGNAGARVACGVIRADSGQTVPVVEGSAND
jgi:Cu-Zn family superoxide dismutase